MARRYSIEMPFRDDARRLRLLHISAAFARQKKCLMQDARSILFLFAIFHMPLDDILYVFHY